MYSKIINPTTGRKVSVNGKIGRNVLRNYLNILNGIDLNWRGLGGDSEDDDGGYNFGPKKKKGPAPALSALIGAMKAVSTLANIPALSVSSSVHNTKPICHKIVTYS